MGLYPMRSGQAKHVWREVARVELLAEIVNVNGGRILVKKAVRRLSLIVVSGW